MSEEKSILLLESDEEIERCLTQPWYRLNFPAKLEARFEAKTSKSQRGRLGFGLLLFAAAHLAMLLTDFQGDHSQAIRCLEVRAGLVVPVCLVAAAILRFNLAEWAEGLVAGLPVVIAMIGDSWLAFRAAPRCADIYCMALLLETFVANLILPLRIRQALLVNLACVVIYLGLIFNSFGYSPAVQNRDMDAAMVVLALVSFGIRWNGEGGDRCRFLLAERDRLHVQQLAWANRQLKELSYTDALTGLPNRRFFNENLLRTWNAAREADRPFSLLMIDVDRFKRFNDALGHAAGDKCLRTIAGTLQFSVRVETDTVARYGGEEFLAILPNAPLADALHIAERVRFAVAELQVPHPASPEGAYVTVSVGVASCPNPHAPMEPEALFQSADLALYAAKSRGRNCVAGEELAQADLVLF
jgi:diguanylate cyclase (GGDEF)-like protein